MQPKTQKQLNDIRDAAAFILQETRAVTADAYKSNRLLRQAVERNFEIIGEAVNRIRQGDPGVAARITNAERIVAFRNVLIHGYHLIDDDEVWRVITNSLPILLNETEELLSPPPPDASSLPGTAS